jgi:predicted dehydrogenase
MDYTQQPLLFKVKKGIRYVSLYGINRTIAKIRAQYHMKREYPRPQPLQQLPPASGKHVGLIGCGKFAYSNIAYYIRKNFGNVIRGVVDIDINKAISLGERYKVDYYTENADQLINDPHINLIYIASNHASHAEYAIQAIRQGKAVHIEKPHAVTVDQLERLCQTVHEYQGCVRLGFNRPDSTLGTLLSQYFNDQSGTAMINWFVAGHEIEADHWYFAAEEGGRILGNLCHWIDFTLRLIPEENRFPVKIIPTRSEKSDCDISVSYVFGDGSIGTITFSAKGHTFEGVRETLNAHKGNVLANLTDFKNLRIDLVDKIIKKRLWNRDHGHEYTVVNSYRMLKENRLKEPVNYIWDSGYLTLKTKEALDTFRPIDVSSYPILQAHS